MSSGMNSTSPTSMFEEYISVVLPSGLTYIAFTLFISINNNKWSYLLTSIRFIALKVFNAISDHRDKYHKDEGYCRGEGIEGTDGGESTQNGNDQEINVGETLELVQDGQW